MKALIFGISGQDGSYLAEYLLSLNYEVIGFLRPHAVNSYPNIETFKDKVKFYYGDLLDFKSVQDVINKERPDEIYNLAAQSQVKHSFAMPTYTADVIVKGSEWIFECAKNIGAKVYQASSSEMFGTAPAPQDENTPFNPANPYACAKLHAHNLARLYRKNGLFVSCGILFNHESERRGYQFVTQKVCHGVACALLGLTTSPVLDENGRPLVIDGKITLGNLEAIRDWGYSPDYVVAMHLMLQQERPDDYIVATGIGHTVEELTQTAYGLFGLDYQRYILLDESLKRPVETPKLIGKVDKISKIGWKPSVGFNEMITRMVKYQYHLLGGSDSVLV